VANALAFADAGDHLWSTEENWDAAWLAAKIVDRLRENRGASTVALGMIDAAAKMIADLDMMLENETRLLNRSSRS
jgi:hypothetical protein